MTEYCEWVYRPGTGDTHWAYTTCRPGYNPLTRIKPCEPFVGCADLYNGKSCPICNRPIKMNYGIIELCFLTEEANT